MAKMTEEDYQTVLRIWAASGGIEHHEVPLISEKLKNGLVWLLLGAFCGFIWGLVIGTMF